MDWLFVAVAVFLAAVAVLIVAGCVVAHRFDRETQAECDRLGIENRWPEYFCLLDIGLPYEAEMVRRQMIDLGWPENPDSANV